MEEEQEAENDKEEEKEQAGAEAEAEAGKACNFALLLCVAYFCAALFPRFCNFVCAHLKFINVCVCECACVWHTLAWPVMLNTLHRQRGKEVGGRPTAHNCL